MTNLYFYSNTAQQTTLTGSISAGATSVTVAATTGFPGSFPYALAVDYGGSTEELVKVTAAAGATLTVERGFSGTSAQSHSLGAVVRHVYHAGDATDFRTHEDTSSSVHGVTGALVGATQVQTLTNKTLTSPTINSAALSGTFSGTPTFSGAVTHSSTTALSGGGSLAGTFTGSPTLSGAALFTGTPIFQAAAAATVASSHRVAADTTPRLQIRADGQMQWGPGNAAADTVLYRASADVLATDDTMRFVQSAASGDAIQARVSGDAGIRYLVEANGTMAWGDGSSFTLDTNLYRSAANTLKTDDDLVIKTHSAHFGESNTSSFSFTSQTSDTKAISFGTTFASIPRVFANINSPAGSTSLWHARCINVTTSGFTLFVFGPTATWSGIEVYWAALAA